jgi:protein SCO1/2
MTPASWPGKLLLITFGYRFCPDICPTNLGTMARALDLLGADGAGFQPLFVTVDPDRDTVANLADYVTQFHPRLVGLTGTHTQIDAVARTFGVYYLKVAGAAPDAYTVDHSSYLYVADDHGKVMKIFSHDITAEQLAAGLKALLPHAAS